MVQINTIASYVHRSLESQDNNNGKYLFYNTLKITDSFILYSKHQANPAAAFLAKSLLQSDAIAWRGNACVVSRKRKCTFRVKLKGASSYSHYQPI